MMGRSSPEHGDHMQNWDKSHTQELNKWFNIETYKKFENLSLHLLYHELSARTYFFKTPLIGNEELFDNTYPGRKKGRI
jgi:hypothetical protein